MPEIDILMAAYNGGRFIAEQIDSILAQTFQDFRLLIRDDGSSDNTPAIIEDYAQKYPDKIEIVHDDVVCKSPAKNFMELLKHARADYVMFCDQDDYWLPYKLQVTIWHMKRTEHANPNKPVLVCSGMKLVDSELHSMGSIYLVDIPEKRYSFRELLPSNCSAGCTQMMNRIMYQDLGEWRECIRLHDWWTMLYASAFGVIEHIPAVLMLYRQHENNVIGAHTNKYKNDTGMKKLLGSLRKPVMNFMASRKIFYCDRDCIELFAERYHDKLSQVQQVQIREHLKLFGSNRLARLAAMHRLGYMYHKDKFRKFLTILKSLLF